MDTSVVGIGIPRLFKQFDEVTTEMALMN